VGFEITELEIDATSVMACAQAEDSFTNELPRFHQLTKTQGSGFKFNVVKSYCTRSSRCSTKQQTGDQRLVEFTFDNQLGRWAWIKKCEHQVLAFKTFLETVRKIETEPGDLSFFSQSGDSTWAYYYPRVTLKPNSPLATQENHFLEQTTDGNQAESTDNAPLVSVSGTVVTTDDLAKPSIQDQVTIACPTSDDVLPITMICSSGCYTANQRLLISASGQYEAIGNAMSRRAVSIAALSSASNLESPNIEDVLVGRFTASERDAKEPLREFFTESGLSIVVTLNHPLLDGNGIMREARNLTQGEELVRANGKRDKITQIREFEFFGKVFNVGPFSQRPEDNLIVAEGLINGSLSFQNELHSFMNHQLIRSQLSDGF
jgi:hypothetical protein